MRLRLVLRIGACACLGIALTVAALSLRGTREPVATPAAQGGSAGSDPLRASLRACQRAGEAAASDPACLRAWDENRRRFLGQRPEPEEPDADIGPGKSSEPVALPDDISQQQEQ